MIRLFVSDLDGTLLNENHQLSEENVKAVRLMREKGISFLPASGRDSVGLQVAIEGLQMKPKCICLNGAEFYDNDGTLLISNPIDQKAVYEIQKVIDELGCTVDYFTADGRCLCYDGDNLEEHVIERYKLLFFGENMEDPKAFIEEHDFLNNTIVEKDVNNILKRSQLKIEFVLSSFEQKEKAKEMLSKIDNIITTSSHLLNLEINSIQATKGHMIEQVCENYGYSKDEVVVIGDGINDIPMLEMFPNSYAMGQAQEEVKNAAKYIADTNANDGVAKLIYQILEKQQ